MSKQKFLNSGRFATPFAHYFSSRREAFDYLLVATLIWLLPPLLPAEEPKPIAYLLSLKKWNRI